MFEEIMDWHLRCNGDLGERQTLSNFRGHTPQDDLFECSSARYNFSSNDWLKTKEITLPHLRATVQIVHNDAKAVIQSLLTDP